MSLVLRATGVSGEVEVPGRIGQDAEEGLSNILALLKCISSRAGGGARMEGWLRRLTMMMMITMTRKQEVQLRPV